MTKLQANRNLGKIVRYEGRLGMIERYYPENGDYSIFLFNPHAGQRRARVNSGDLEIVNDKQRFQ